MEKLAKVSGPLALALVLTLAVVLGVSELVPAPEEPVARSYGCAVYTEQGCAKFVVASGGETEVQSGGVLDVQSGGFITVTGAGFYVGAYPITHTTALTISGVLTNVHLLYYQVP